MRKKADRRLAVLAALYFAGVLAGVFLDGAADTSALDGVTEYFLDGRLNRTFWETLKKSFSESFLPLLLCFWLGFSAAGQPFEPLIPALRGVAAGLSLAGLYEGYGLAGIGMSAVLIVPGAALSAFALIIAAREALELSGRMFSLAFGGVAAGTVDLRLYLTKFALLCGIIAVSALLDSLLTLLSARFWVKLL